MSASVAKLKGKDLKVTPQRIAIYDMLCGTVEHPTVETIYKSLFATYPCMSLATVYKTVDAFKGAGLVNEINVGEDSFRYDANVLPHHHMICTKCRAVYDSPPLDSLETLKKELTEQTDFHVTDTKLYFYGICKQCSGA